jgi:quinoprotein glucose dehydrogenase
MVFAPEPQGVVIALDAKTGHQIWAHTVVPPGTGSLAEPPIYYNGKILMATSGGDGGFSCIVFALDAKTGKPLWHFNIIPQKGQPGYETWTNPDGTPGQFWNGGGASWTALAVDPVLNDVYISTGNTIPYTGYQRGPGKEYYTAGTLALHIDTGKEAWFFQDVHHDNWDADTTLGPILFDAVINGKLRHAITSVNRTGLLFVLDRATGQPILPVTETPVPTYGPVHSYPTQPIPNGILNGTADPIFPKTLDDPNWTAFNGLQGPDGLGFLYHNNVQSMAFAQANPTGWTVVVASNISGQMPSSYDPNTGLQYVEGTDTVSATEELPPSEIQPTQALYGGPVSGGIHNKSTDISKIPQVAALNGGYLVAMDVKTGKRVWMDKHLAADVPTGGTIADFQGGIMTTDSGLLFTGTGGGLVDTGPGTLAAFDDKTGAQLWSTPTLASPWQPITYSVNGKQYVATEAGAGGLGSGGYTGGSVAGQKATVLVYALP